MTNAKPIFAKILSIILALTLIFTNDPNIVNAIQMINYDYITKDMKLPDLIGKEEAKAKGYIERLFNKETENSFVFKNINDEVLAINFGLNVKVKSKTGSLEDIELDFVPQTGSDGKTTLYKQKGSGHETTVPVSLGGDIQIGIEKENNKITMTPIDNKVKKTTTAPGQLKKIKDYNGKINYKEAFGQDTEIELSTTLTGIKEDIILKKNPKSNIFSYEINANGLLPSVTTEGIVNFYDAKQDKQVFSIPSPYAIDSYNGERLEGEGHYTENIKVTMKDMGEGKWIYSLEVDREFLDAKNTVYPVIIDPPLTISNSSHEDAYVNAANPSIEYWNTGFLSVGKDSTLLQCRSYVKANINDLTSKDGLMVTSAYYNTTEYSGYTSAFRMRIYQVKSAWTSTTINWGNQPTSIGTEIINDTANNADLVDGAGVYSFNITKLVNNWFLNAKGGGGYANNGFVMRSADESALLYRQFRSANASINPPNITVVYTSVDRTAPTVPTIITAVTSTTHLPNPLYNGTAQLKVTWATSNDLPSVGGSGLKYYELRIKKPDGTYIPTITTTLTTYTTPEYYPDNGTYIVTVSAIDKAKNAAGVDLNNTSITPNFNLIVPDCEKPTINSQSITPYTSLISPTNVTLVTLNWNVTEPSALSKLEYYFTNAPTVITTITNPALIGSTNISIAAMPSGSYTLCTKFTDTLGNVSGISYYSVYVDRTLPTVTTSFNKSVVSTDFTLPLIVTDNMFLSNIVLEYGVGKSPTSYTTLLTQSTGITSTYAWSPIVSTSNFATDQYYTIRVKPTDAAGNAGNILSFVVYKQMGVSTVNKAADIIASGIPQYINTKDLTITHNKTSSLFTDLLINGVRKHSFMPNSAITMPVNKSYLPEGQGIDIIIRSYYPNNEPQYNVSNSQEVYTNDFESTSDIELNNMVVDTATGTLKPAPGYTSGMAIITIPKIPTKTRIDAAKIESISNLPAGSYIQYFVYQKATQSWGYVPHGAWLNLNELTDEIKIKIEMSGSVPASLSMLKVTYNNLDMAPVSIVKLVPDVANLKASPVSTSAIALTWDACPQVNLITPVYNVYKSTSSDFIPDDTTKIFTNITETSIDDTGLLVNVTYYYKVLAVYQGLNSDIGTSRTGINNNFAVGAIIPDYTIGYETTGRLPFRKDAGIALANKDSFTDIKTGNFSFHTSDLSLSGWQINMDISRSYNSTLTESGNLGSGWKLGIENSLNEHYTQGTPSVLSYVVYTDQYGTAWKFTSPVTVNEVTTFNSMPGSPYTLTKENNLYQLTDDMGMMYKFNSSLKLSTLISYSKPNLKENLVQDTTSLESVVLSDTYGMVNYKFTPIKDLNGNITGFTKEDNCPFDLEVFAGSYTLHESIITTNTYTFEVNDPQVNSETLKLLSSPLPGALLQISALDFTYAENGNLELVKDRAGHLINLIHDTSGKLTQITDNEGRQIIYEYFGNGMLQKVKRLDHYVSGVPSFAETNYTYDINGYLSSISDPDQVSDILTFDATGRLTSHSSLYNMEETGQATIKWNEVTYLDYLSNKTVIRKQMQRYEKVNGQTQETLTDINRLTKIEYSLSTQTGIVSGESVFGVAVKKSGEDGLDETDYDYALLKAGVYEYLDTNSDNCVDSIKITYTDTNTPAKILNAQSYLNETSGMFSLGYYPADTGVSSHYDLSYRRLDSCDNYLTHSENGHKCESYTYSLAGRVLKKTSNLGHITIMEYNLKGDETKTVYPDGHVSINTRKFMYNATSPQNSYFEETNTDYGMNYTSNTKTNLLGQNIYEDIISQGEWLNLEYTYNYLSQLHTKTDGAGNVTTFTYDNFGRTTSESTNQVNGPDLVKTYTYNIDGEILTEKDAFGNTITYVYESSYDKRILSKTTVYNGKTTKEEYDYRENSQGVYTLTTTHPDNTKTITTLTEGEEVLAINKSISGLTNNTKLERTYTYSDGNVESMGHNGFKYVFTYDEDGEVASVGASDGTTTLNIVTFTKSTDSLGNTINNEEYSSGQTVIKTSDSQGRLKKIDYSSNGTTSTKYEYEYSSLDNSSSELDGNERTKIKDYVNNQTITTSKTADEDSYTNQTVVKDTATLSQLYAVTVINNEEHITYETNIADSIQSYEYAKDSLGRLNSTIYTAPGNSGGVVKTDSYGGYGEVLNTLTSVNALTLISNAYSYKVLSADTFTNQVEQESIQYGASNKTYGYTYDDNGNITRITVTTGGVTQDLYRYVYDEAGELIREDNVSSNMTYLWKYDMGGNIVQKLTFPLTGTGVTPIETQGTPRDDYSYGNAIWKDQLTSYKGQAISYDSSGNPTSILEQHLPGAWEEDLTAIPKTQSLLLIFITKAAFEQRKL